MAGDRHLKSPETCLQMGEGFHTQYGCLCAKPDSVPVVAELKLSEIGLNMQEEFHTQLPLAAHLQMQAKKWSKLLAFPLLRMGVIREDR